VGIVDYGMGNHSSVIQSLRNIGFRTRLSDEKSVLDSTDVLILPGVGAFPSAMQALHQRGLVEYLREQAKRMRPIVGICLGMQLLATASHEYQYTTGLDLIPGEVKPLVHVKWHIGWNTIECVRQDSLFRESDGESFYFNHSFSYQGPSEYHVCVSRHPEPFASVIRRNHVVGIQFHPEKSQTAGRALLQNLVEGLVDA